MKPHGLIQRGNVWHIRLQHDGREVRKSTRTSDLGKAIEMRDAFAEKLRGYYVDPAWQAKVDAWVGDSNSWLCCAHANMRYKSKKRGWSECMTFVGFVELVKRSNGRCAVTGLLMEVEPGTQRRHRPLGISIDRIDSARGYVDGNVRLVCLAVNIAMRNWGEESLRIVARAIVGRELISGQKPEPIFEAEKSPEKRA